MAKKEHFIIPGNAEAHVVVKDSTEGGACLTGHDSANHENFGRKNTCNFRYQGLEQAKAHKKTKSYLHSYKRYLKSIVPKPEAIKTSAYETKAGDNFPAWYCSRLPVPQAGDWDVGGPKRPVVRGKFGGSIESIAVTENFTRGKWPYWNNAHHLIPKGELGKMIRREKSPVGAMIEAGLLKAKYNVNHKYNMLMMPQDKEVAQILDMPRHIQLQEGDAPGLKSSCTDHPVYNKLVRKMKKGLKDVVSEYRDTVNKAIKEKCEEPDYELSKKKLEQLSKRLLDIILAGDGGASIDKLASLNPEIN